MGSLSVNVGGAWRSSVPSVNVGGAWRTVTGVFVNVGGSWRQVYSSSGSGAAYNFTLNSGQNLAGTIDGYSSSFGAITPSPNLPSTSPALDIRSLTCFNSNGAVTLVVEGFSADPGASWLQALSISGSAFNVAAASYSYSGGAASWLWTSPPVTFAVGNYTCSLTHA